MLASSVFLETSIPNTPSITVLSFHLVSSARAPLRTTLYAGSTLTRVPRYRPICTAKLGKRGLIYRTGSFAKGTQEAHRSPRSSAKCVYSPSNLQRTRDDLGGEQTWRPEHNEISATSKIPPHEVVSSGITAGSRPTFPLGKADD